MLNKIFSKKTTQILSGENNSDLALRLMFKIAISDGKLVSSELTLIKKRASSEIFKFGSFLGFGTMLYGIGKKGDSS